MIKFGTLSKVRTNATQPHPAAGAAWPRQDIGTFLSETQNRRQQSNAQY
jgi:hypothetical protein